MAESGQFTGLLITTREHSKTLPIPIAHTVWDFQHPIAMTGLYAAAFAAHMQYEEVHLWGFDGGSENYYAGTPCYTDEPRPIDEDGNRQVYEDLIVPAFPDTIFIVHGESYLESHPRRVRSLSS